VALTTYAVPTIVGELKRHFRDTGWAVHVPRRLKELNLRLNQTLEPLSARLGRSPTVAELAAAVGVDEEEVLEALDAGHAYSTVSLSAPAGDDDAATVADVVAVEETGYETSEDRALLVHGAEALDARERRIVELRFRDGLTQTEIAAEIGISQMHVSRLIRRSLEKMRGAIEAAP
jgi:RNA polymerase sigma-B factor